MGFNSAFKGLNARNDYGRFS